MPTEDLTPKPLTAFHLVAIAIGVALVGYLAWVSF